MYKFKLAAGTVKVFFGGATYEFFGGSVKIFGGEIPRMEVFVSRS
jgi:hypothetical protein